MANFNFSKSLSEVKGPDGTLSKVLADKSLSGNVSSNSHKTPSRYKPVPSMPHTVGDRYIPDRSKTDIAKLQYEFSMSDSQSVSRHSEDQQKSNILKFAAYQHPKGADSPEKIAEPRAPVNKPTRVLSDQPVRALDAPGLQKAFYLNLINWSSKDILAVGLANEIFLWNAECGSVTKLMETEFTDELITSVAWSPEAPDVLAVGTNMGRVQLWDSNTVGHLRTMVIHPIGQRSRCAVLSWRDHFLTAGSFDGTMVHCDIRVAEFDVARISAHSQEICGLAWSPDKKLLASGGNDDVVRIWAADERTGTALEPLHQLVHNSAVKALAWCPWKPCLLVSGGGKADHKIRFWNAATGVLVKTCDGLCQISGIAWSQEHRELVTSHGEGEYRLRFWKYPSCSLITELSKLSEHRALGMAVSPCGEYVGTLESNEIILFWHAFEVDLDKKKRDKQLQNAESVLSRPGIR